MRSGIVEFSVIYFLRVERALVLWNVLLYIFCAWNIICYYGISCYIFLHVEYDLVLWNSVLYFSACGMHSGIVEFCVIFSSCGTRSDIFEFRVIYFLRVRRALVL